MKDDGIVIRGGSCPKRALMPDRNSVDDLLEISLLIQEDGDNKPLSDR